MKLLNLQPTEILTRPYNVQVIMENILLLEKALKNRDSLSLHEDDVWNLVTSLSNEKHAFLAQHILYGRQGLSRKLANKVRRFAKKRGWALHH